MAMRRGASAPWRKAVVERVPVCGGHSTHEWPRTNHPRHDDCATPRLRPLRRIAARLVDAWFE